jgi:phosphoglycolate phosphatase
MPKIGLLITDLDNTLFDWVNLWYECFSAMLDEILRISGIDREILIPEIKAIHQKHGTSEYAFLIEEIPSLIRKYDGADLQKIFDPAIHVYRIKRREHLKLYPTVLEALTRLKRAGTLVVGYTESMAYYTSYRVKHLGLDGLLDFLYSPEDHDLPKNMTPERLRMYPADYYELKETKPRVTPKGRLKPDAEILLWIVGEMGALPGHTAYVGDSLMKDIPMAQHAGIADLWAKYGSAHKRPEYRLLQDVTHWTEADVRREQALQVEHAMPTRTLFARFDEMFNHFEFGGLRS